MSRAETGETPAFQKLLLALGHAEEACTEIGVRRQDKRWSFIGIALGKIRQQVTALYTGAQHRAVQGRRLQ